MKRTKKFNLCILVMVLFSLFFGTKSVQAADDYQYRKSQTNVECKKVWNVMFNKELDKNTINNNVIVLDEKNNIFPIKAVVGSDKKSIKVTPRTEYIKGKKYVLIVRDEIKTTNGKKLKQGVKMNFTIANETGGDKKYTICIDPGHGGYDNGNASGAGSLEKNINLKVALKAGEILKQKGVNVVYTRTSDTVSWNKSNELKARFDISNKANADYFISVHCNTYPDSSINGIETYYAEANTVAQNLAKEVQSNLIKATGRVDRGVKSAFPSHEILRGTVADAIMVELGFMSNSTEVSIMDSSTFQNSAGKAIAEGVIKTLSSSEKNTKTIINRIDDINNTILVGQKYQLPTTLEAIMDDGSTKKVGVIWDNKLTSNLVSGTYKFKGTVAGYGRQILLNLVVKDDNSGTSDGKPTICIDPGHGMRGDTGATGQGLKEDDVVLTTALKVGQILKNSGVNVVYTRTKDETTTSATSTEKESLQKRCDISNNSNAKYFVSIHCNAFGGVAYGTETFYYTSSEESKKLATYIQNNIINEVGTNNRGLKDGNWLYVIDKTKAPSVLVELGFLTDPNDAFKLSNNSYLDKYAHAISKGILQALGKA